MTTLVAGHPLAVQESTATYWLGAWRRLVIVVVYPGSHDDLGHIVAASRLIERLGAGGPVRVLGVLPEHGNPPSQEVRDGFIGIGKRLGRKLERVAFVVPGSGFRAATHRAAVSGMIMLLRPQLPVRIESETQAALAFLLDGEPAARAALCEIVQEQLRPARAGTGSGSVG